MNSKLRSVLESLVGKICWATIAGKGTGSAASLYFGAKVERERPVQNEHLSFDAQRFDGEYVLFIQDTAWRIESPQQVLCSSLSSDEEEGPMVSSLRLLEGKRVVEVKLREPSLDFVLCFEDSLTLTSFNFHQLDEEWDNYSVSNKDECVTVVATGDVVVEPR